MNIDFFRNISDTNINIIKYLHWIYFKIYTNFGPYLIRIIRKN